MGCKKNNNMTNPLDRDSRIERDFLTSNSVLAGDVVPMAWDSIACKNAPEYAGIQIYDV
jgi:hypothetical protein